MHRQLRPVDPPAHREIQNGSREDPIFLSLVDDDGVPRRLELIIGQVAAVQNADRINTAGPGTGLLFPGSLSRTVSARRLGHSEASLSSWNRDAGAVEGSGLRGAESILLTDDVSYVCIANSLRR